MEKVDRNYIALAVIPVLIGLLVCFLIGDILDSLIIVISIAVCVPIATMGLFMYLEGRGYRFINGIDWSEFTQEEKRDLSSYVGKFLAIGSVMLLIALNILLDYTIVSAIMIIVSIGLMLFPIGKVYAGSKVGPMPEFGRNKKVAYSAVMLVIMFVAAFGLGSINMASGTVTVDLGDNSFTVKAPMFNETFTYSEIDELEYDPDFDKGDRMGGYGTPTISSGKYKNAQFGTYRLASYTKVDPCVWIKYHGSYYAFNQATDDETRDLYEQLRVKTGL